MWQPLVYGCLTSLLSVCGMTMGFATEIDRFFTFLFFFFLFFEFSVRKRVSPPLPLSPLLPSHRDHTYATLLYGILAIVTAWINMWYFGLYFFLYFQHGRWFKLHILSKIQQSAVTEYWNFHFVDVGNLGLLGGRGEREGGEGRKGIFVYVLIFFLFLLLDSKFYRYRALVLTNDSYADTVETIRADIHAKRKHIDKIREEGELDSAIKSRDTGLLLLLLCFFPFLSLFSLSFFFLAPLVFFLFLFFSFLPSFFLTFLPSFFL